MPLLQEEVLDYPPCGGSSAMHTEGNRMGGLLD